MDFSVRNVEDWRWIKLAQDRVERLAKSLEMLLLWLRSRRTNICNYMRIVTSVVEHEAQFRY
jgi:hypothetical protein